VSLRESAISHCLDPARQNALKQGELITNFERVELIVKSKEEAVNTIAAAIDK